MQKNEHEPKVPEIYTEPTDEDLAEFGKAAQEVAFANLCWLYSN